MPDSSIIDLSEVLKCEYDTVYVFGEFEDKDVIRYVLGTSSYDNRRAIMDSHRRFVFVKDGNVVYEDDVPDGPIYFKLGAEYLVDEKIEGLGKVQYYKFSTRKFISRQTGKPKSNGLTLDWDMLTGSYEVTPCI